VSAVVARVAPERHRQIPPSTRPGGTLVADGVTRRPSTLPSDLLDLITSWRPAWHAEAACHAAVGVDFYPGEYEPAGPAVDVCAGCPVRLDCLDAAWTRGEPAGVWGGSILSDRQRAGTLEELHGIVDERLERRRSVVAERWARTVEDARQSLGDCVACGRPVTTALARYCDACGQPYEQHTRWKERKLGRPVRRHVRLDVAALAAEYSAGATASDIAERHGSSTTTVLRALKAAGVTMRLGTGRRLVVATDACRNCGRRGTFGGPVCRACWDGKDLDEVTDAIEAY
jgi:WhiB family redox-sensing transcriptional regulator